MTMEQAVNSMFATSEEVTQDEVQEETIETEVAQDAGSEDQAETAEPDGEAEEDAEDSEYEADEADAAVENSKDRIPVKINGKTELWTLDELKRSAAGQGYIQQGMREVADIKKEAGSVYQALQQERQQLSQIYNQLTSGQVPLQAGARSDWIHGGARQIRRRRGRLSTDANADAAAASPTGTAQSARAGCDRSGADETATAGNPRVQRPQDWHRLARPDYQDGG